MSTLRKLVEEASAIVDVLFEPEGQMLAYFLAVTPSDERVLIACPMVGPNEERAFRVGFPKHMKAAGHKQWVFFCEAWTAAYQSDEPLAAIVPKERPDRMEVVTFTAEDAATDERLNASRQIYRDRPEGQGRLLPLVFAMNPTAYIIDDRRQA